MCPVKFAKEFMEELLTKLPEKFPEEVSSVVFEKMSEDFLRKKLDVFRGPPVKLMSF